MSSNNSAWTDVHTGDTGGNSSSDSRRIEVLRAGALTTVQDLGRPGWAHLGVPHSGALDPAALALANRLVGNPEDAAGLEITLTGCALRVDHATTLAVTGAYAPIRLTKPLGGWPEDQPGERTHQRPGDHGRPLTVPAGTTVHVGPAQHGLRSYLAVAGGFAVRATLGSRSTDTLSGLGPPPLRDGDLLPVGQSQRPPPPVDFTMPPAPAAELHLGVRLGPRDDWFTPAAVDRLLGTPYTVTPVSDRIGARLAGAPLPRAVDGELPSEGIVLGAVQVPADGQPLVFLADHPTTGGYPVIGVVGDPTPLAQAVPGTTVRFHGSER